jgi:hypothetical protein
MCVEKSVPSPTMHAKSKHPSIRSLLTGKKKQSHVKALRSLLSRELRELTLVNRHQLRTAQLRENMSEGRIQLSQSASQIAH